MPLCIALVQSRASVAVWDRCPRRALRGDRFCADHRHALDGAVIGLLNTKENCHAHAKVRRKPRREFLRGRNRKTLAQTSAEAGSEAIGEVKAYPRPVRELRVDGSALAEFFGQEVETPAPAPPTLARTPAD